MSPMSISRNGKEVFSSHHPSRVPPSLPHPLGLFSLMNTVTTIAKAYV